MDAGSLYATSSPDRVLVRGQSHLVRSASAWTDHPLGQVSPWSTVSDPRFAQRDDFGDPFLEPQGVAPHGGGGPFGTPRVYDQFGGPVGISGINGPQPFRYGWQPRLDAGYLPKRSVSPGSGKFGIFELDAEVRNTVPLSDGSALSIAPQFGWRVWESPTLAGGGTLPNSVFRTGTDFEWTTSAAGPWSTSIGFTPSINSDFERSLTSNAYNIDGRAMLFYRASAEWMYVLGIGYWDRVNDRIIPYSGVVWTPSDRTELRLMFPESRISHYIGNYFSDDKWVYASAGFHVEAYEIEIQRYFSERAEKIELSDWRAVIGLRSENDYVSSFIEGGIVFDRQVDFLEGTPGFDISSGFILRGGLRF